MTKYKKKKSNINTIMTQPTTNNIQMQCGMMIPVVPKNLYDTLLQENQQLKDERNNLIFDNQRLNIDTDNLRIQQIKLLNDIKQKDLEIEILRSENELLRKEIAEFKKHITEQNIKIDLFEKFKNKSIASSIRIAINDLDDNVKNRIDPNFRLALEDVHHDRIIDCHYFDRRYSENAKKYGKYKLLCKLKSLSQDIIDYIDGLDTGFVDAVIKSIETENIDGLNIIIDPREKKRIEQFWDI